MSPLTMTRRIYVSMMLVLLSLLAVIVTPMSPAAARPAGAPEPFLYRPYYGTTPVISRAVSLFDHDHPDYSIDNVFVRYDGKTFNGAQSATNCTPGVSCYDGHNGYDLNMVFEPVLAAGAGTVIRAGWFNASNHLDGGGLWVAIDHGNGYTTMYCHLSAVHVRIGETVAAQWQIGTSGSTGSATGPHLHFTAFQMPGWIPMDPFGWQPTDKPDPNTVPDYYLWVANPVAPTQSPCLGCNGSATYPGALVVDDGESGFSATGTWKTSTGTGTIGNEMRWTYTTNGSASASATWQPTVPATGAYAVGVYVDPMNAGSEWTPYTITSIGQNGAPVTTSVWLDQMHIGTFKGNYGTINTGPRWVSLGTYTFVAGASVNGQVMLSNATGVTGVQLGADAVEFVPVSDYTAPPSSGDPSTPTPPSAPTATPVPPTPTPVPGILPPRQRGQP